MKKQPGEFSFPQLPQSKQRKPLLSLYIQDSVQNGESPDSVHIEQVICVEHFSSREEQFENPASPFATAKGKSMYGGQKEVREV